MSFIAQKLPIHSDRRPGKRTQDILYIHDTLELFGGSLDELGRLWRENVRPTRAARTAKRAETVARDRHLAPETVQRACDYGLREILSVRTG